MWWNHAVLLFKTHQLWEWWEHVRPQLVLLEQPEGGERDRTKDIETLYIWLSQPWGVYSTLSWINFTDFKFLRPYNYFIAAHPPKRRHLTIRILWRDRFSSQYTMLFKIHFVMSTKDPKPIYSSAIWTCEAHSHTHLILLWLGLWLSTITLSAFSPSYSCWNVLIAIYTLCISNCKVDMFRRWPEIEVS